MSFTYTDILKLSVLVVLYALCFYSGIEKFAPDVLSSHSSNIDIPSIKRDYSICDRINNCDSCQNKDTLQRTCFDEMRTGYDSAEDKCSGYLKNLATCRNAHVSQCKTEVGNLEGCTGLTIKDLLSKWSTPQNVT